MIAYSCWSFFVILGLLSTLVYFLCKLSAREEMSREETKQVKAVVDDSLMITGSASSNQRASRSNQERKVE
jgi:hypothetical protein